jgi:hypothetical protein
MEYDSTITRRSLLTAAAAVAASGLAEGVIAATPASGHRKPIRSSSSSLCLKRGTDLHVHSYVRLSLEA